MILVFDSNIWLTELGLRSGAGAAARFYINQHGARLALPEVVRLEVENNLQRRMAEHIAEIQTNYRQLLMAFGKLKAIVLPTAADVEAKVQDLFDSVEVEKVDIPFSLERARSSFLKTVQKVPPSDKTQEFKDGVIWADCLALLESSPVVLVSGDKAFYEGRQLDKGLARNLAAEASQYPNSITLYSTLSALLQTIRTAVSLDEDHLAQAFLALHGRSVNGILARQGFDLGVRQTLSYTLVATETPHTPFLEFTMNYACTDVKDEGRTDATLALKGDGSYLPATRQFLELRNFGEQVKYREPDGTERENRNAVASWADWYSDTKRSPTWCGTGWATIARASIEFLDNTGSNSTPKDISRDEGWSNRPIRVRVTGADPG